MTRTARSATIRETDIRTEDAQREPVRAKKQRTRRGGSANMLSIPSEILAVFGANGVDLQWNTEEILGIPATQFENTDMQQQGWEPVTTGMFDGALDYLMPKGHKGQIMRGGCRLDHRPMELTHEARAEELQTARQARGIEERKITSGVVDGVDATFMNTDHAKARANTFLRKEIGRVPGGAEIPS